MPRSNGLPVWRQRAGALLAPGRAILRIGDRAVAPRRVGAVLPAEPVAELHALGLEAGRVGVGDVVRDAPPWRAAARPGERRRRCWRCPCRCSRKRCAMRASNLLARMRERWRSDGNAAKGAAALGRAALTAAAPRRPLLRSGQRVFLLAGMTCEAGSTAKIRHRLPHPAKSAGHARQGFLNGSLSLCTYRDMPRRSSQWPQAAAAVEPEHGRAGSSRRTPEPKEAGGKRKLILLAAPVCCWSASAPASGSAASCRGLLGMKHSRADRRSSQIGRRRSMSICRT